jgi:hypothetical protein
LRGALWLISFLMFSGAPWPYSPISSATDGSFLTKSLVSLPGAVTLSRRRSREHQFQQKSRYDRALEPCIGLVEIGRMIH